MQIWITVFHPYSTLQCRQSWAWYNKPLFVLTINMHSPHRHVSEQYYTIIINLESNPLGGDKVC